MHNFRELSVWQKSRGLIKEIYLLTTAFPITGKFGLSTQIKNSSNSIISNIAEGSGRGSNLDFKRFLNMALGSSYELETQIIISADLNLVPEQHANEIIPRIQEIQKMILGLIKSLD